MVQGRDMNPYAPPSAGNATRPAELEKVAGEVKRHAIASVVIALVGLVFCGPVLGPLAIYRSTKATRLIEQNNVAREYSTAAQSGRLLGYMDLVVFFAFVLGRFVKL